MAICRFISAATVVFCLASPAASFGATSSFHAVCRDDADGWTGHTFRHREQAQTEADQHNQDHPGHHAYVIGN